MKNYGWARWRRLDAYWQERFIRESLVELLELQDRIPGVGSLLRKLLTGTNLDSGSLVFLLRYATTVVIQTDVGKIVRQYHSTDSYGKLFHLLQIVLDLSELDGLADYLEICHADRCDTIYMRKTSGISKLYCSPACRQFQWRKNTKSRAANGIAAVGG